MAYSGGIYTKPVQSGVDNLSQLYLQGRMQVVNMRAKVRKERSDELAAYQKAASEIEATGINEADKLYQKGANDLREFAAKAHNDNILGKITRSQATARVNNYISQASQLANATKIVASKVKELDEGIAKKDGLAQISKDLYLGNWFTEEGGAQATIKVPDEKGGYDLVPAQELLSVETIDDQLHFKKAFNYYDANTKRIEVGTTMSKIGGLANVNPYLIKKFDINKSTKDFVGTIGKTREVSMVRGEAPGDIEYAGAFKLGDTDVFTRVIAPEKLKDIANTIEVHLDGIATTNNVISFWADVYGAKAPNHKGFQGIGSQEEIKKLFGSTQVLGEDGKPTGETIPKFYDELGNGIELTDTYEVMVDGKKKTYLKDPRVLQLNEYGIVVPTNDQIKLMKASNRDRILKAMNVKVDTFKNRERLANQAKQPKNVTASVLTIQDASGDFKKPGFDYFASLSMINDLTARGPGATIVEGKITKNVNNLKNELLSGGAVSGARVMNQDESMFLDPNSRYHPVQLSSEISDVIENADFTLNTATKNIIKSPTGFVGIEEKVDDPNKKPKINFFFVGDALVAENKSDFEIGSDGKTAKTQLAFNKQGKIVTTQMSLVQPNDYMKLYTQMFKNSSEFRQIMEDSGYDVKAKNKFSNGASGFAKALLTYTKQISDTRINK
ncbi:MAG: hypothetical protein ABF265_07100 [Polaribacter sp.]